MTITRNIHLHIATAATSGAVAILQLHGDGSIQVLEQLTGKTKWETGRVKLVHFAGIDEGLAVCWRGDWVQLMPHGGPRVVKKIVEALLAMGVVLQRDVAAKKIYPEASSELEAEMLATIARAASPAAIEALSAQCDLWRAFSHLISSDLRDAAQKAFFKKTCEKILARSRVLDRLVLPPTVVVVGKPNVGKSTLTNYLMGHSASIVADLPGTTRDWVAGLVELPSDMGGIVVRWLDTPGVRETGDEIERAAIAAARDVIANADVLIAMRDPQTDWPGENDLPRAVDVRVMNKADQIKNESHNTDSLRETVHISANTGQGIDALRECVVRKLGFSEAQKKPELWAFSMRLKELMQNADAIGLREYLAQN